MTNAEKLVYTIKGSSAWFQTLVSKIGQGFSPLTTIPPGGVLITC